MSIPGRVNVNVSVDDAHVSQIDQVAAQLRAAGMHVDRTLAAIGSISGHVTGNLVQTLRKVPGVSAVEHDRSFQLPPPDAEIQ
jgi:hypothetical protein